MNFLSKLLLPKVAGPLLGVLITIIIGMGLAHYTKSQRIESLTAQLKSCKDEKALTLSAAQNLSDSNIQKDEIIRKQTVSIKSLKETSDASRASYHQRLQASMAVASALRRSAEEILKLESNATDELGLCRAARDLLEKELTDAI